MTKVILIVVSLTTVVVGLMAHQIMQTRYSYRPIWVEQAAYLQYPSLVYANKIAEDGYLSAVSDAISSRERHLLQILVLGLFGEKILAWRHAHLLIVLPALGIFLFLLAKLILARSKSIYLAIAAILFFCAAGGVLSSEWGIGAAFADWQSMLLLSVAVLSLVTAFENDNIWWIRLFAIFASLAVLARSTSAFFGLVILAPILAIYLFDRYKKSGYTQIWSGLLTILIISLPAFVVVVIQLPGLIWYYTSQNAYVLKQPLGSSLTTIMVLLRFYLGKTMGVLIILMGLWQLILAKKLRFSFTDLALWWWLFSFLGFLLINGYASDIPKEVMYIVAPMIILALSPMTIFKNKTQVAKKMIGSFLIVYSLVAIFLNYQSSAAFASRPVANEATVLATQWEMAAKLASLPPDKKVWQPFVYPDWGIPVAVLTDYQYGNFRRIVDGFFHNRKNYWGAYYPNYSVGEIVDQLYQQAVECLDAAVILKELQTKPAGMEDYSFKIAQGIAEMIQKSPNFSWWQDVSGQPYVAEYAIYVKNIKPAGQCSLG